MKSTTWPNRFRPAVARPRRTLSLYCNHLGGGYKLDCDRHSKAHLAAHGEETLLKKNNMSKVIEAEAAFAAELYRDRAALNRKAQELLGTRIARAKQQAQAKGLCYQ